MKKKSVFFVSVLCALMSFVFTGCKDEDENQLTVPTEVVTGVTFTDTDQVEGVIKGTLKWIAPDYGQLLLSVRFLKMPYPSGLHNHHTRTHILFLH